MFDALVTELSQRYGLDERGRELFGLLVGYIYNDRRGGLDGFIESFRLQGHGQQAASWTSNSLLPLPITASDIGMVFGQGLLSDWGTRLGVSRATVAAAIAGVLPRLVAALATGRSQADAADAAIEPPGPLGSGSSQRTSFDAAPDTETVGNPLQTDPARPQMAEPARPRVSPPGSPQSAGSVAAPVGTMSPPSTGTVPAGATTPGPSAINANTSDLGSVVPGRELGPAQHSALHPHPPMSAAAPGLRREPRLDPGPAPAQQDKPMTAAEQRIADMAAALGSSVDRPGTPRVEDEPNGKFDTWRPAIHRPPKRKASWPVWLLLLLLLAAIAGIAWYIGLIDTYVAPHLDPLLQRYGFKLLPPPR